MSNKNTFVIGCLIAFVVIFCCICVAGGVFSAFLVNQATEYSFSSFTTPTTTPNLVRPEVEKTTEPGDSDTPDEPVNTEEPVETEEADEVEQETYSLSTLEQAIVPENDPRDLAERLLGIIDIPELVFDYEAPYEAGDEKLFWVLDTDTNISVQQETTLGYVTDHAYFWIGNDVSYHPQELELLAKIFERNIYPTNRSFFGSEWSPGVDGDEHIYIVYVGGLGGTVAGYFSPGDELHPLASEYSNSHELFMLNADNSPLSTEYTQSVLAHEFQHMIHWNRDRNETSWLNEGFSELSALLNGYGVGGFDYYFMENPDNQLNDWPNDGKTRPNYGSAFLFVTYFLDRMGSEATQTLIAHPANGFASIDLVLEDMQIKDPLTEVQITADDLVLDWGLSNYIQDDTVMDGRFIYNIYHNAPQASETETLRNCSGSSGLRDVEQYGTDYIRITCNGSHVLRFTGSILTNILEEYPHTGEYAFWSNKGDESDMTLTKSFDFTDYFGPINFNYWLWYDLEQDYDYLYLLASVDGGDWEFIETPSGTDYDPSGNSYGWGYNGLTEEWIEESVDLSRFAGHEVRLRFEYITDAAVHGEGLLIDDISIPEINYSEGFEEDAGGWESAGFVRIDNKLPQTYNLALITYGEETTVEYLTLEADMIAEIPFRIGEDVEEVVLVVQGTTRYTRQKAAYKLEFLP